MAESDPLRSFPGQTRLFPLPDNVLFPAVVQPLHIHESRYLEMVEESLQTDRFLAMALLKPGWQSEYFGRPPIEPIVCLGHIINYERIEGGKINLLLRGAARARVVRELPPVRSFREARLEVITDDLSGCTPARIDELSGQLLAIAERFFRTQGDVLQALREIVKLNVHLGHLCDLVAHLMPLEVAAKQSVLAESKVMQRVLRLLRDLDQLSDPAKSSRAWKFPPDFSQN